MEPRTWLARVRVDQMRRWQQHRPIRVETYLESLPRLRGDEDAILDLIYNEVVLREEAGEGPSLLEYQSRFPSLAEALEKLFADHADSREDVTPAATSQVPTRSFTPGAIPLAAAHDASTADGPARPSSSDSVGVGQVIAGDYEVTGTLGKGGMGIVYKARQLSLPRTVALKMILGQASESERRRASPSRRKRSRGCSTPTSCRSTRSARPRAGRSSPWSTSTAAAWIGRFATRRSRPSAARLAETLARAMHAAHQANVIHRDLKPANILMTKDGVPKITDFGLAKHLAAEDGQTLSGTVMGTPSYMPPEQACGLIDQVGPLSDVYSLGAILYELLTGRPPFKGATVAETLDQVRTQDPVPPTRLQPKVPRDLETICLKCLEKNPRRRYCSAEAMADDLQRWLQHEPILARPASLVERTRSGPGVIRARLPFRRCSCSRCWRRASTRCTPMRSWKIYDKDRLMRGAAQEGHRDPRRRAGGTAHSGLERAEQAFVSALNQFGDDPEAAELRKELDSLRAEAQVGLSWQAAKKRFDGSEFDAIYNHSLAAGPELEARLKEARTAILSALEQVGVKPAAPMAQAPAAYFTAQEQEAIRQSCRGLLLLLADCEARSRAQDNDAQRRKRAEQGLQVLQWAAGAWPATEGGPASRAFHLQRADYLQALGRGDEAARARDAAPPEAQDLLDHFRLGLYCFRQDDAAARHEFSRVLSQNADHFWANYYLALCAIRQAEQAPRDADSRPLWQTAQNHLTTCERLNADFAWSRLLLGRVRAELGQLARPEEQAELFKQAAADLTAVQQMPRTATDADLQYGLLTTRGILQYRRNNLDDALADLEAAGQCKPGLVPAYTWLARVLDKQGKRPLAIAQLDRAIALDPTQAGLYRSRANLQCSEANLGRALEDMNRAVRLELPRHIYRRALDHSERARLLVLLRQAPAAAQALDEALASSRPRCSRRWKPQPPMGPRRCGRCSPRCSASAANCTSISPRPNRNRPARAALRKGSDGLQRLRRSRQAGRRLLSQARPDTLEAAAAGDAGTPGGPSREAGTCRAHQETGPRDCRVAGRHCR